jgi:hypothetical protein
MKDKILALLMESFAGVRKDGLSVLAGSLALQATTEDEATSLVGKLTAEQVGSFIADWRKEADSEISKANQTYEQNLRKKYDFTDRTNPEPGPPAPPTQQPDIAKLIEDTIEKVTSPLKQELESFKAKEVNSARLAQVTDLLKDTPKSYKDSILAGFGNMNFQDDAAFGAYIETTKANAAAMVQEIANSGLGGHQRPTFGAPNSEGISSATADYIKSTTEPSGALSGKEI